MTRRYDSFAENGFPTQASLHARLATICDEELVRRAMNGQREAFGELARRYQQMAYTVAHRILGNDADACMEAVQQGFTNAFARLASLKEPSAFPAWLRRVVRNVAITIARRKARWESLPEAFDASYPGERKHTQLDKLIAKEERELAVRFLREQTTAEEFLICRLRIGEELSYSAIANRIEGQTPSKVRHAMNRLLRKLKEHMALWE
jgi:RNA polymerase sigma-70 factor (ECF subfamily)